MSQRGLQAAFAALHRRLDPDARAPVALALSGGGDSLALLYLAAEWARSVNRPLLALTIDHRLHDESAAWTAFAGAAAARVGAGWRTLAWEGDKPAAGLPAAAREARHRLLARAARQAGAQVILLGHTQDDVREAAAMRLEDAPGLPHLREWSPSPAWPDGRGVFLLRPLLEASRAELRDLLRQLGETWLEDPANSDPRFARARARLAGAGARPQAGAPFAARHQAALASLARLATATDDGRIVVGREFLREAAGSAGRRFVAAALLCAGGGSRPPRGAALDRMLERLNGQAPFTATQSGSRVVVSELSATFAREAGERARGGLAPVELEPFHAVVWDGRFEVTAERPGLSVAPLAGRIGALGAEAAMALKAFAPFARPALPVLLDRDGGARLPRPFGAGPGEVRALAGERLKAACGLIEREAQLGPAVQAESRSSSSSVIS